MKDENPEPGEASTLENEDRENPHEDLGSSDSKGRFAF